MKLVDLSVTLENDRKWAPWWARNSIKYQDHRFGRRVIRLLFGIRPRQLRTELGWANEVIKLSTHGTTHVDAPWHYGPLSAGEPAATIDQLPLERFFGPGIVLDMRHVDAQAAISVEQVEAALGKIEHTLSAGDIVLIQTGNDRLIGSAEYFSAGPGVSAEATHWLIDRGVRLMGIDSWGWDQPLATQAKLARQTGRDDLFWSAHFVGTEKEYCHMERLANLAALPPKGFQICAFPLKVKGGSAGPARVVAMLHEE